MAHPPVQYRDRALRRLSFVSKGLAFGAIVGTGGITAAIAHATPAQPATAKTTTSATPKQPIQQGAARGNAPAPASRGKARVPAAPANGVNTVANRVPAGAPAPPPVAPTTPPSTSEPPPPAQPGPTTSGGS
ncbi:MAG: hypothetical protein V7637_5752 [Mycobacteriales bacterium]